ncbi:MAG: flagellar biosynthesis protein FlhF [Lachnospiraceae bacterium]|nr:flagellar biosynthesis protein FlhF [Lachnospiraceae bacterium]
MLIKKFTAATEKEAIELAQKELGKDAVVMNVKKVPPKGIRKIFKHSNVEVTAATDDNNNYDRKPVNFPSRNKSFESVATGFEAKGLDIFTDNSEHKETSAIEQKLDSLQSMLEKQMEKKQEEALKEVKENIVEEKEPTYVGFLKLIYNQLINNEVDEKYANQIIAEIEPGLNNETNINTVLAAVYQKIVLKLGQTKAIELQEGKTKFVFFIGPTGVGKTTTIAKLASTLMLSKKLKVALFTVDTYRIKAVEQLQTYADILGIPLKVIYTDDEMKSATEDYMNYDVVLIDTAGRSHRNLQQRDDIEKLIATIPEEMKETYLVLSATTKYRDLIKITETYSEIVDYRLLFTKLDETGSIGNIFNMHMLTDAPLSYATFGQNVPDDISRVNPQKIAKQLLGGNS